MDKSTVNKIINFIQIGADLRNSRFIGESANIKYRIDYNENTGMKQELSGFDEDHFRSALMFFRKIYMKGEPTYFFAICNIISRYTSDITIKNNIIDCKNAYKKILANQAMTIVVNKKSYTNEEILDIWLNGNYFHGDENKASELQNLKPIIFMHKMEFVITTTKLMKLAIILSNNAKMFLLNYADNIHVSMHKSILEVVQL